MNTFEKVLYDALYGMFDAALKRAANDAAAAEQARSESAYDEAA